MKEISNRFCIIPPELLTDCLTPQSCRYVPHGAVHIMCSRKIVLDQSPASDTDGHRWSVSMSAASTDSRLAELDGKMAYIGIFLSDGSVRILGTPDFIPKLEVTPYSGAFAISVSYDSLKPVDL